MRQTNREDRFSSINQTEEGERERENGRWLCSINIRFFFLPLPLSLLVVYMISSFYFCLSICVCVCAYVEYRRKVVPRNIDQKNRSVRHFFPSSSRRYSSSVIDAEKDRASIFICGWIYIHSYTEDKSSARRRENISNNNNILPQSLTYARLHR